MKVILKIILFLITSFSFSQTKEELVDLFIKSDYIQLENNRFRNLQEKISENEIYQLTKHKSPIIRTYAKIVLIEKGKGDILSFLKSELEKNESVNVFEACLGENKTTSTVIYETYLSKKSLDTLEYFKDLDYSLLDSIVVKNKVFKQIDSIVIYSNANLNHFILNKIFDRNNNEKNLLQIEKLAFEKNIASAFLFLNDNYNKRYEMKTNKYFNKEFQRAKFITKNEKLNLIFFLNFLLESENKKLNEIGIKRLKKQEWKNQEFSFIIEDIIEKQNIRIE